MKSLVIKKTVMAALFAALTFIATYFVIPFPIASGYINLGDCFVLLGGLILGPYGFLSAAIGSTLCDILLGFIMYAPATFIIKGCMALIIYFIAGKKYSLLRHIIAAVLCEALMICGYFVYECFALKLGLSALASVPYNCIQGLVGASASIIIYTILKKTGLPDKIRL